ncbi:MAG: tetratricopeptide repeat protein [Phycisphaeraceae bacterium]|nr:tetratricopeptide repeat protein [Phycisphaeraceae bacterium]
MANAQANPVSPPTEQGLPSWSKIWHLPTLLLSLVLLALVVSVSIPEREEDRFDEAMDRVERLLSAGRLDEAQQSLERMGEGVRLRAMLPDQARYIMLWGDLVYLQDQVNDWQNPENYRRVDDYYRRAEQMGLSLDARRIGRWAEMLVGLNRYERAMELVDRPPHNTPERKLELLHRILERRMSLGAEAGELLRLLDQFERTLHGVHDRHLVRRQGIWAAATRARILLDQDSSDSAAQAAHYLERTIPRYSDQPGRSDLALLEVYLGHAYRNEGRLTDAEAQYRSARSRIDPDHRLNGEILVGLGEIALSTAEGPDFDPLHTALDYLRVAEEDFQRTSSHLAALVGRAHVEALLDRHHEALERFGLAAEALAREGRSNHPLRSIFIERVITHHQRHFEHEDFDMALAYLDRVRPLHPGMMPQPILLRFAQTFDRIGHDRLREAEEAAAQALTPGSDLTRLSGARRSLNQSAGQNFEWAGDHFHQLADSAFASRMHADAADALWSAAESFDRAQLWGRAVGVYQQFIQEHTSDPRAVEARHRLGMAYMAMGRESDLLVAREHFRAIIDQHRNSPMAIRSFVPLARCELLLGDPRQAQARLEEALDHPVNTPETDVYRDALIQLGRLHHQEGHYIAAIERLSEAADPRRYGSTRLAPTLLYLLADSLRMSARAIAEQLDYPMPHVQREELKETHRQRLETALDHYTRVIDYLLPIRDADRDMLSVEEKEFLQDALMYRADCAYELGRYRKAIELYSIAAADESWNHKPGMLVAMVRIVNCYTHLGEVQNAISANRRAVDFLNTIPDHAFDDPRLPMDRRHWRQWLTTSRRLSELSAASP